MAKREYKLESFPQEFFKIWELACEKKLALTFEERGTATNLKQRLYMFRRVLMRDGHPYANKFYQTDLRVQEVEGIPGKWAIVDYLPDWKKAVQATESVEKEVNKAEEVPVIPSSTSSSDHLSESLANLGFGTGEIRKDNQ